MPLQIERIIDDAKPGAFHWRVMILCALVTVIDGFDIQAMASVTPALGAAWHMPPAALRWILTAALIGIAASALFVSPLGDYLGRRTVLLASFGVVGLATLLAAFSGSPHELLVWRFVTGIGLGASLPNALALTAEYAPARLRTMWVALMACGISLGASASGFIAPVVIAHAGWHGVFLWGGVFALCAWVPLFALPESLRFLIVRGRRPQAARALLQRLGVTDPGPENSWVAAESASARLSVTELLTPALTPATVLLWLVFFLNLGLLHMLAGWLPTLLTGSGLPHDTALRVSGTFQLGGVAGGFGLAWLMRRWGPYGVLAISYVLTAIALAAIGVSLPAVATTVPLVIVMGNGFVGGQVALNALSATLYPTSARVTGVGWALGMGRFGGIVAPLATGMLMSAGIPVPHLFAMAIVPTLICALAVIVLQRAVRRAGL